MWKYLLLLVAVTLVPPSVFGAEVFSSDHEPHEMFPNVPRTFIYVEGEIQKGDLAKIKREALGKLVVSVTFWSPGGDVAEALDISEYLSEKVISVNAPQGGLNIDGNQLSSTCEMGNIRPRRMENCVCNSACAIIWLLTPSRGGGRDTIGVHRPRFDHQNFSKLSLEEAEIAYSDLLSTVEKRLYEKSINKSIIERMMSTPSSEIYYLSEQELDLVGDKAPVLDELLTAKCSKFIPELERYQSWDASRKNVSELYKDACTSDGRVTGNSQYCQDLDSQWKTLAGQAENYYPRSFWYCRASERLKLSAKAQGIAE